MYHTCVFRFTLLKFVCTPTPCERYGFIVPTVHSNLNNAVYGRYIITYTYSILPNIVLLKIYSYTSDYYFDNRINNTILLVIYYIFIY